MPIRKRKPTSPGRRFQTVSDFAEVTKGKPEKSLTKSKKRSSGRNVYGRTTSRHRGGGHKQKYRDIDFKRAKDGVPAKVASIEYDPNRNARIALLHYRDGEKRYILAPAGVAVGDVLQSGQGSEIRPGNALPMRYIPVGTTVHNVELRPGGGGKMARSAGSSVQLVAKEGEFATLRLPSTDMRRVRIDCRATGGDVGNFCADCGHRSLTGEAGADTSDDVGVGRRKRRAHRGALSVAAEVSGDLPREDGCRPLRRDASGSQDARVSIVTTTAGRT